MQWPLHLMLLPAVVALFIFNYVPLYGLVLAFQKYNPALGFSSPWIGFGNFKTLFSQPNFVRTIWNTFFIAIMKIVGGIIVPVFFSLLLNEVLNRRFKRILQTIIYIPNFLSWVIMAGLMIDLLSADGIVNTILGYLGMAPVLFLGDEKVFPWTMILSDIWKTFGFGTVVYLAALTSIDPGLYESAMVDGAKRWKQTLYITLPLILPIVTLMSILALGNVLNAGFDQIFNLGAPIVYNTGDIIDTYVYRMGIERAQYSIATAVGMFKSIISGTLIAVSYVLADKIAGYRVF
jgi:putative aldouronate transport system permease protein